MPYASLLDEGRLKGADSLAASSLIKRALEGEREVVATCGSGVTACVVALAFARMGREVAVYDGSWTDWGGDHSCPLETG